MNKNRLMQLQAELEPGEAVFLSSYPSLFYYTGFCSEDGWAVIMHDRAALITDSRYTVQAKAQTSGVEIITLNQKLEQVLQSFSADAFGFEEEFLSAGQLDRLKNAVPGRQWIPMQERIARPRQEKSPDEIRRIREAERLGDEAFSYVLTRLHPGMTERAVAAELEFFMKKNGASGTSFDTIAASGYRSAMPHGVASDKQIQKGELLTLDFGCVLDGYCSDMTRTVGIGSLGEEETQIYNTVLRAQKAALDFVQEGVLCADVDRAARLVIEAAGYGSCFGHSLGHSLGIEIHEAPNFLPKSDAVLKRGNVITVEPGIYVEGLGGVRIEDVIAVTDQGIENLTSSPKELILI